MWRARRALARHRDLRVLLAALDAPASAPATAPPPGGAGPPGTDAPDRLHRGVYWAVRLLPLRSAGPCLYAALTLYGALRRRGFPAYFVSGVRRDPAAGVVGHAWVELDDRVLDPIGAPDRDGYVVSLRHPPA